MVSTMIDNLIYLQVACNVVACAKGKQKLAVLQAVCKDPYTTRGLMLLLDARTPFGIRDKSLHRQVKAAANHEYEDLLDMCEDLAGKNGISDVDIANVQQFLSRIEEPELRIFADQFVTKSLALGVAASTFNKAIGYNALGQTECMLAKKYFEHTKKVEGKEFTITEKLDGIRAIASVVDGEVFINSRQGVPIQGLVEVESDLLRLYRQLKERNFTLDGELIIDNRDDYLSKEQYKRTTMIVRKDGEKHGVTYHVFDCMGYLWGTHDISCESYSERRRFLQEWCFCNADKFTHLHLVPVLYSGTDTKQILQELDIQRKLGHEGVMVNLNDEPYEIGRSSAIFKVKVMQDCDLKIVGMEEGSGRLHGTLGNLLVDYKGTTVGVGTGFTDEDRMVFWNNQQKFIGRVVTIQYFEETCDAKGVPSIRFPVYKELREEGKEVSYS